MTTTMAGVKDIDFGAVVDSAPDAVVIVATDSGEVRFVNTRFTALFGYQAADVVGKPVETLMPSQYRTVHVVHRQGYARQPITRSMGTGLQLAAQRQDGSQFPVEISLSTVTAPDGMLTIAFVRDTTDRKRADVLTGDLIEEISGLRGVLSGLAGTKASPAVVALLVALVIAQVATMLVAR